MKCQATLGGIPCESSTVDIEKTGRLMSVGGQVRFHNPANSPLWKSIIEYVGPATVKIGDPAGYLVINIRVGVIITSVFGSQPVTQGTIDVNFVGDGKPDVVFNDIPEREKIMKCLDPHCQSIKIKTRKAGPHIEAFCGVCLKYIKFVSRAEAARIDATSPADQFEPMRQFQDDTRGRSLKWLCRYLVDEQFPPGHLESICLIVSKFNEDLECERAILALVKTLKAMGVKRGMS